MVLSRAEQFASHMMRQESVFTYNIPLLVAGRISTFVLSSGVLLSRTTKVIALLQVNQSLHLSIAVQRQPPNPQLLPLSSRCHRTQG